MDCGEKLNDPNAGESPLFGEAARKLLSNDPEYKTLTLATHHGVPTTLLAALAQNSHVHTAHFEMTAWDDAQCDNLLRSAPGHSLTSLHLTRNRITSAGLGALSELLTLGGLTSLNLSGNPLDDASLAELCRIARVMGRAVSHSQLKVLNLNETQQRIGGEAPRGNRAKEVTLDAGGDGFLVSLVVALTESGCGANRLNALHLQKNFVHDEVFRQGSNPGMPTHATFLIDQRSSPSCERSPTASPHRSPWPACARSTWA